MIYSCFWNNIDYSYFGKCDWYQKKKRKRSKQPQWFFLSTQQPQSTKIGLVLNIK